MCDVSVECPHVHVRYTSHNIIHALRQLFSVVYDSPLHSAKGGVVETGCSDLYAVVY